MKINYVGSKTDGETAFSDKTEITWFPGDCHEVSADHAEKMLKHPDVFALADEPVGLADAKPAAVLTPAMAEASTLAIEKPAVPLESMTREALQALAKERGVKFHPKHGAPKLIELLAAALPQ